MIRPVRPDGKIETGGVFVPILRRRVVERISSAAMQRVVLIVAPAGYGKSVALRHFLDTVTDQCIRYDVLPDNATLLGFLRGLADALSAVAPDARATLAGAHEKNADAQNPGIDLAMWMHSHIGEFSGTIAIDDLHIAQGDREVTRFLASLIERTRGRVQWVIASRSSQGLPIGTWLAYGDSDLAIDEHDLKFTVEEAKEAARAFKLGVRDEELYELLNVTEGWATAMSFALRSSTRSVDLRSITSVTREMIYRYLAEQVYATLEAGERDFIETAALLPSIDFEVLVEAGFDRAMAMTEELRERTAFIHEPERGVFRLHDLFREFVLHQRELRGERESFNAVRSIGAALERMGRIVPALRFYVESNDADAVRRVLVVHGIDLIAKGFSDEVDAVLASPIGRLIEKDAVAMGLRGLLDLARGKYDDGVRRIQRALRNAVDPALKGELILRYSIHSQNQNADPVELLTSAIADETLSDEMRLEAEAFLAVCHARHERVPEAEAVLARFSRRTLMAESLETQARVLLRLGTAELFLERHERAQPLLTQAAELGADRGLWGVVSKAHMNLSVVAFFGSVDLGLSATHADAAAAAAIRAGDFHDLQAALLMTLNLETWAGNEERTIAIERQLADLRSHEAQRTIYIVHSQAERHAWAGRFGEAHRLFGTILGRQHHLPDRAQVYAMHALCLAMDRRSGGQKSVELAIDLIDAERESGTSSGALQCEAARLLAVTAETVAGRLTSATRLLKPASLSSDVATAAMRSVVEAILRAKRTKGYDVDQAGADLDVIRRLGFGGYAKHLQNALRMVQTQADDTTTISLTPSELHVVRCLAMGLTQKAIAEEMGRSALTVQTHIQNVIEKLGCSGRNEAVATAKRLGLLGDE